MGPGRRARRPTSPATPAPAPTACGPRRPRYDWTQNPAGTAASYVTPQLSADTAVLGAGAFKAWIRSPARDVDLQVTVSEVRPDGKETFVQSGWLRTAARKLDREKSTQLEPVLSLRKRDLAPLPRGEWTKITVPLYYQGHVYRAGSSIRVTISAVGGDQPVWAFSEVVPERRPRSRSPTRRRWRRGCCCRWWAASTRRPGCRPARRCAASPAATTSRTRTRARRCPESACAPVRRPVRAAVSNGRRAPGAAPG